MKLRTNSLKGAIYALGLALLLLLALALLPAPVHADVESPYDLYVGGEAVTGTHLSGEGNVEGKEGTWTFTPALGDDPAVLTLEDYNYVGPGCSYIQSGASHVGIYYNGTVPLVIELVGNSSVTMTDTDGEVESYGIRLGLTNGAPVTIQKADGADVSTLTAAAATALTRSAGVRAKGSITVAQGATLNAQGSRAGLYSIGIQCDGSFTVSGTVNATGGDSANASDGVMCGGGLTVENGGVLDACAGTGREYSYGVVCIICNLTVKAGAALTAQGATQAIYIDTDKTLTVGDGMVIRAGADAEHATDDSYTGQPYVTIYKPVSYDLWIGGEEVTSAHLYSVASDTHTGRWDFDPNTYTLTLDAYVYEGPGYACNSSSRAALYYNGADDLTITLVGDSSLTAVSGDTIPLYSFGMYFDDNGHSATPQLTIQSASGGSLTARAGAGSSDSYGIYIQHYDLLLADADVEAIGGNGKNNSIGLFASSSELEIGSGAHLTALAGKSDGSNSFGVYCESKILVSGGTLDAKGGQAGTNGKSIGIFNFWNRNNEPSLTVTGGALIAEGGDQAIKFEVYASLYAPGMTVRAGESETQNSSIAASQIAEQKYVKIYKSYDLWVGGEEVTVEHLVSTAGGAHTGSWSFDPDTYTLTLDAYHYSGEGYYYTDNDTDYGEVRCAAALFYDGETPLTIELAGENSLTQVSNRALDESYGLLSWYKEKDGETAVTIRSKEGAEGSLTLTAGQAENYSQGVYAYYGSLDVDGVTLSARAAAADASYGLETDGLTITDSTVYAVAADAETASYGIQCYDLTVGSGAKVNARSGAAADESVGVYCLILKAKDKSILFAEANTEPKDGGSLPAFCAGISCIGLNVSDDASDVTPRTAVTAHAGKGAVCYGIECGSLAVKDAGVMAYAGGENECRGIGCDGYGSKLKANIVGTETFLLGFCRSGKGVGIEIDQPGWLDQYLGIFDSIPMAAAMTEEGYFARLAETETPFPLVCVMRKYDVTLDANGGSFGGAETKSVGVAPHTYAYIAALDAEPVRAGYTLTGWALDAAGEQPLEDSYTVEGDTTLYALWKYSGGAGVSGGETRPPAPKAELTGKGKVTFDPKNPARGAAVTVTAAPDEGWELADITAKDSEGKEVPLTKNADGTYTFTQGDKAVTVTAAFAEKKADDPLAAFADLDAAAWYAEDVRWALTEGVMDGMGGGVFAPGGTVSRAMVAQVLWKLAGSPVVNYALPFTDVGSGAWYTEAVRWAASARLVQGYEDGTFRPENPVTRQELATMLYRWARTKGLGFTGLWMFRLEFADAGDISDWALEPMSWMVMQGVLNGRGENLLVPGGTATRSELAAILHRLTALTAA